MELRISTREIDAGVVLGRVEFQRRSFAARTAFPSSPQVNESENGAVILAGAIRTSNMDLLREKPAVLGGAGQELAVGVRHGEAAEEKQPEETGDWSRRWLGERTLGEAGFVSRTIRSYLGETC